VWRKTSHFALFKDTPTSDSALPSPEKDTTCTNHVGVANGILLQTAFSEVSHSFSSVCHSARILFDSGSQKLTFLTILEKGLKTIRTENLLLKTFGKSENVLKKHISHFKRICVEALCVPFICDSLTSQNISTATKKFPSLKSLKLADFDSASDLLKLMFL